MAFNGAGVFSLVAGNPVVTGTTISSTWANNTLQDIANNGLTNCITKDGQQTVTANIPFNGFRLTGIGDGVNLQDAVDVRQLQNGGLTALSAISGTDTITAVASPTPAAYVAGQVFDFIAVGANTTGSVTLNISSLGAKSLLKYGAAALTIGDIQNGQSVRVRYDGTNFQMISPPATVAPSAVGSVRNLACALGAATTIATWSADEIVVGTVLGGTKYILSNLNQNINIGTTGANGMDTGSAPASGFVAIYAIYNSSTGAKALLGRNTTSSFASTVYNGANMPSGYTASALIAVWPTNASAQFIPATWFDRSISFAQQLAGSTTAFASSLTALAIPGILPQNARFTKGSFQQNANTAPCTFDVAGNSLGFDQCSFVLNVAGSGGAFVVMVSTSQTIYYLATTGGTMNLFMWISGYTI